MSDHTAEDVARIRSLAALFERSPRVRRLAAETDPASIEDVASEAADSLVDIHRSAELLSSELLPRLQSQEPESAEFDDTLDDIAEELRHIHYHIVNTKLFDYVVPK
ncbi:MAG: hypothetical protein LH471_07040 [Salinibacterium sp.]|nr:hypothetical protein [Salinibacterium sp.]